MKTSDYWKGRFETLEAASNSYGLDAFKKIEPAFDKAQRQIQGEIEAWYGRIAANNKITIEEARKLLNADELKEFHWDVKEFIKYGHENEMNQMWMKELENASAKFHISRLEALKIRTQQAAEVAFGNELDAVDAMAKRVYTENYYHSIFEVQKGFGVGWEIGQVDNRKLEKLISKPWAADGKNFSDRIWNSKSQMVNELHQQLTRTCLLGKTPDDAIKEMSKFVDKKFKNAKVQAGRLVMTEQAYFHSVSQKDAFNDLDVEEFEVVATLDSHTSEVCQEMDGKHFPMKDYEPGVTAPPFHVWCRSVTVPFFDDEFSLTERAARDVETGETYYVPSDMTYKDWKKSQDALYGDGTVDKKRKMSYNESADKMQFSRYKELIGVDAPKSFKDFQKIKYGADEEYTALKLKYADARIQHRIKNGKVPTNVLEGKQGKHIRNHNNYIQGRSYLNGDVDVVQLVKKYAGTGIIKRDMQGKWTHKEEVTASHPIGYAVSMVDGSATETSTFIIHYSKKGVHIVPKKEG